MPYASQKQMAFMHAVHPDIAARWDREQRASGRPFPHKHADGDITPQPAAHGIHFSVPDPATFPKNQMRSFGGPPSNAANASMDKGDKEMRDYVENGPQSQEDWSRMYGQQMATQNALQNALPDDAKLKVRNAPDVRAHDMDLERRFPEARHPIDSLMDHMSPREFRYKNPADGMSGDPTKNHRPFLGVMAQEIKSDPSGYGKQIVRETPHGMMLETKPLVSALTAGVGRLHDRVSQLENHVRGLMHAAGGGHRHHSGAAPSERDSMLSRLHEIVSRKLT